MKNTILKTILIVAGLLVIPSFAAALDIMPVSEIKEGMTGTGYSVFKGAKPDPFKATIIGVVKKWRADQDLILAELSGAGLEESGIIAGMSGSPVYIDGRMIGAVAYAWAWSRRPIAGITPIEHMIEIWDEMDRMDDGGSASSAPISAESVASIDIPEYGKISMTPISTPLYMGGFGERAAAYLEENLSQYGLMPVQGGGAWDGEEIPGMDDLEPGSVIAVPMVTGDFMTAGVGTVTAREGDRIVAFGHPFFGMGNISLPMGGGSIVTVMPLQSVSFKVGNIGRVLGAVQRDHQAAIAGTVGAEAEMFPMKIIVNAPDTGRGKEFNVNIAQIDELQIYLLMVSMIEAVDRVAGDGWVTVSYKIDGKFRDYDRRFHFEDMYFSTSGVLSFYSLSKVLSLWVSHFKEVDFEELTAEITVIQDDLYGSLRGFSLDKSEIHPGDILTASVRILPYGTNREIKKDVEFTIPPDAPAGSYKISIHGGSSFSGMLGMSHPQNFEQWFDMLENMVPENALVVTLHYPEQGLQLEGHEAHGLPHTVQDTIVQDAAPNMNLFERYLRKVIKTDMVIEKSAIQTITVTKEYQ
ncbi:SpoIVB peptidase S55 domain-containing protein [bacterium]